MAGDVFLVGFRQLEIGEGGLAGMFAGEDRGVPIRSGKVEMRSLAGQRCQTAASVHQGADAKAGARAEHQTRTAAWRELRPDRCGSTVAKRWQRQRERLEIIEKQALLEASSLDDRCTALITLLEMERPGQGGGYVQ
jgi:hypothetical protein